MMEILSQIKQDWQTNTLKRPEARIHMLVLNLSAFKYLLYDNKWLNHVVFRDSNTMLTFKPLKKVNTGR